MVLAILWTKKDQYAYLTDLLYMAYLYQLYAYYRA